MPSSLLQMSIDPGSIVIVCSTTELDSTDTVEITVLKQDELSLNMDSETRTIYTC